MRLAFSASGCPDWSLDNVMTSTLKYEIKHPLSPLFFYPNPPAGRARASANR